MNPNLPYWMAVLILGGRMLAALLALGAVVSKPLESAIFVSASLAAAWFVVEAGLNLWHQHQEAIARKLRDDELKRQRAEEARLRFEAAQREQQLDADRSYMDLDLDDPALGDAKIPLSALRQKGAGERPAKGAVPDMKSSPGAVGAMSAAEIDMSLIETDTEPAVRNRSKA